MKTKTFQQRIAVAELTIDVDDPFDFYFKKFKCMAREIFYKIEELYWIPLLDEEKNIIWIEFTATGTVEE